MELTFNGHRCVFHWPSRQAVGVEYGTVAGPGRECPNIHGRWKVVEGGCGRRIHDTKVLEIGKKSIAISSKYHQSTTCPIGFTRSRSAIKTIGFVKCFSTSQGNQNPREEKCMVV